MKLYHHHQCAVHIVSAVYSLLYIWLDSDIMLLSTGSFFFWVGSLVSFFFFFWVPCVTTRDTHISGCNVRSFTHFRLLPFRLVWQIFNFPFNPLRERERERERNIKKTNWFLVSSSGWFFLLQRIWGGNEKPSNVFFSPLVTQRHFPWHKLVISFVSNVPCSLLRYKLFPKTKKDSQ